jgi:hypothetical protein
MARRIVKSISFSPEHLETLDRIRDAIPGMSRSGVLAEVLDMTLPMMEELVITLQQARDESGAFDEAKARDRLAYWTGQQLLKMTAPEDDD